MAGSSPSSDSLSLCPHRVPFQKELCFDEELVLQQLRYTGMLETVRIRRSGYSAKYTFQVGAPVSRHAHPCLAPPSPIALPSLAGGPAHTC